MAPHLLGLGFPKTRHESRSNGGFQKRLGRLQRTDRIPNRATLSDICAIAAQTLTTQKRK